VFVRCVRGPLPWLRAPPHNLYTESTHMADMRYVSQTTR
jgi:hypothetical protein